MMSQLIFIYGYPLTERLKEELEFDLQEKGSHPFVCKEDTWEGLYIPEEGTWNESRVEQHYSGYGDNPCWVGFKVKVQNAYGDIHLKSLYNEIEHQREKLEEDFQKMMEVNYRPEERLFLEETLGDPDFHILFGTT